MESKLRYRPQAWLPFSGRDLEPVVCLISGPSQHCLCLSFLGLQDVRFPQDEAVAPSSPFLEEDDSGKKDSWLAELAGERLMAATSCRSLREHPFRIALYQPLPPSTYFCLRSLPCLSGGH